MVARSSVIAALAKHRASYCAQFGGTPAKLRVLDRLRDCRTGALGGHLLVCSHCQLRLPVHTSCDDRHCPQCGAARAAKWLDQRMERMLEVPHFQVVFTLPSQLRPVVKDNPSLLHPMVFRAGAGVLQDLASQRLGVRLGITAVLHTWTRTMLYHPHVHCLVTAGGLRLDEEAWTPSGTDFLFPVKVIGQMYRGRLLQAIIEAHEAGLLRLRGEDQAQARREFSRLLRNLSRRYRQWGVHVEPPGERPASQALKYLARYVYRVAISDSRMVSTTATHVSFRARGHERPVVVSGAEFVRRFLDHVLPKGLRKVRHYGLYAPGQAALKLERARALLPKTSAEEVSPEPAEGEEASEQEENARRTHCPRCGELMGKEPLLTALPSDMELARGPP